MAQRQGILTVDVRDPFTGDAVSGGHADSDDDVRAQGADASCRRRPIDRASNNYQVLQNFANTTNKAGGKVNVQVNPRLSAFGRFGWRDVDIFDDPNIPLPSGGAGNAETYARNKQFAFGVDLHADVARRCSKCGSAGRRTQGGKNPAALRSAERARRVRHQRVCPTDPRVVGGLPTQLITGFSDLGRQATNPQWQYPTVYNPKVNYSWLMGRHSLKSGYEFQHIQTEVQDVNPLYGRDEYAGSVHAGRSASTADQQPL